RSRRLTVRDRHPLAVRGRPRLVVADRPRLVVADRHRLVVLPSQYSPLMTKNEPRIVPASRDFCLANLDFPSSSFGTSIPSESLKPTARFLWSSSVYSTLTSSPSS